MLVDPEMGELVEHEPGRSGARLPRCPADIAAVRRSGREHSLSDAVDLAHVVDALGSGPTDR